MQFINIMSVDECLKYIAGKHMKPTQYYNFSEKVKIIGLSHLKVKQ